MDQLVKRPDPPGVIKYQASTTSKGPYDVIIVGGGHNGLVCAAFLAKSRKRVLVLEARDVIGGLTWTREMDNAQGFQVSPCSMEFLLTGVQPSVVDQLDLAKYGLKWVYPPTLTTGLFPDGAYMPFYRDRNKTMDHIRRFSARDAVRYGELVDNITAALYAAIPYFQGHPFRPTPGMIYDTFKALLKGRKKVALGARICLSSVESVLNEYFTREEVKAPLGTYSMASFGPISEPGSGLFMGRERGIHEWGVRRPVGGTGQFPRALAACIVDHGGEVRVDAPVAEIKVANGRAVGVALRNGEEISARQVVAATDPMTLATKLLDAGNLPQSTHEQIRGMQVARHDLYIYKIDLALSGRPVFSGMGHDNVDPEVLSTLTLCQTLDDLRRSAYMGMNGEYSDTLIPLTTIIPSVIDRTLVPPGSGGDTLYMYAFNTPMHLRTGHTWEAETERYFQKCLSVFEVYAPGTRDLILDSYLTSPPEFESRYNVYKGNYAHADLTLAQLGPWRPIPDFAGYKTPIDGLWHASSGSFPMAWISGWPGRNTANAVVRALKKMPAKVPA